MEPPRPLFPRSPFALILRVAALNAVLVIFTSAAAYALISGAGIEWLWLTVGSGATQHGERSFYLNPWQFAKAACWLLPLTTIACGWFGLLTGLIGGAFICLRGPRISSARLLIETSILGLPLACFFPILDARISGSSDAAYYPLLLLVAFLGPVCAFICALVFHQRCRFRE
jgi:hypothetical protein